MVTNKAITYVGKTVGFVVAQSWNVRSQIRDSQNANKKAQEPLVLHFSILRLSDNLSYYLTRGTVIVRRSSTIVLLFRVMYYSLKIVGQNGLRYLLPCIRMYDIANLSQIAKPPLEAKNSINLFIYNTITLDLSRLSRYFRYLPTVYCLEVYPWGVQIFTWSWPERGV